MKKVIIAAVVIVALAGVAFYSGMFNRDTAAQAAGAQGQAGAPGAGGPGGGGGRGGRGGRGGIAPLTVEVGTVHRAQMAQQLTVVGNLIGDATVAVVPKVAGRLEAVYVRLGDHVMPGQRVAKIEDQELQEQVKQAQAAFEVANATIRQREADLALAKTNVERSRSLFERQLLPKQTLDDNEARYQSALAQLDLAKAQNTQSQARLDELRITLANTTIPSPVDGFVARRAADPGAFVSNNAPVIDVVDIRRVRLVVNVVEKDLRQVNVNDTAAVNVDAFPGEMFTGRITRLAPVLDPTTRTASIEIEIPNGDFRLKPGMYARVNITTENKKDALAVPSNALVDLNGRRGVFIAGETGTAAFRPVRVGIEEEKLAEVVEGVNEGETVITTGAAALTDGGRFIIAGPGGRGGGRRNGGNGPAGGNGANGAAAGDSGGQGAGVSASAGQRFGGGNGGAPGTDGAGTEGRRGGRRAGGAPTGNGGDAFSGTGQGEGFGRRGGRPAGQVPAGN